MEIHIFSNLWKSICFGIVSGFIFSQLMRHFIIANRFTFLDFMIPESDGLRFKTSFNYCSSGSGQNSVIPFVCDVPE